MLREKDRCRFQSDPLKAAGLYNAGIANPQTFIAVLLLRFGSGTTAAGPDPLKEITGGAEAMRSEKMRWISGILARQDLLKSDGKSRRFPSRRAPLYSLKGQIYCTIWPVFWSGEKVHPHFREAFDIPHNPPQIPYLRRKHRRSWVR